MLSLSLLIFLFSSAIHTARRTTEWLNGQNRLIALDWPTKGADMNPIENLWGYLVCKLNKARNANGVWHNVRDAENAAELFHFVRAEWNKLNRNHGYLQSLVESMPKRLQQVIERQGGWSDF